MAGDRSPRPLRAARRVLLFSAVNCLTVVFHQHESSSATDPANAPSGSAQLRKPELRDVLSEIMDNVDSYGGVLAALVATFLSDVMNSDPRAVHFVHESGLAGSFLGLLKTSGDDDEASNCGPPGLEPSGELIMALPNVLTALSLTEAGAKAVSEADPFPALLSVFCSPRYVMPASRCLLNEMAAIVGTGLDELMRHNPSLRRACLKAVVGAMNRAVRIGKELVSDEDGAVARAAAAAAGEGEDAAADGAAVPSAADLELSRTRLVQYSHNLVQLLEQVLHADDHVAPFIAGGGFDALLDMARWAITPGGRPLVAHVTCLSSPGGAGGATHSTTSHTLAVLTKTVCGNAADPSKLMEKIRSQLESQLFHHRNCVRAFAVEGGGDDDDVSSAAHCVQSFSCAGLLSDVPPAHLHDLGGDDAPEDLQLVHSLGRIFRSTMHVDWLTRALATSVRAACGRANELGAISTRREREWKRELCSEAFGRMVDRLSSLHRTSLHEVCRVRAEPTFDGRDADRARSPARPLVYRIRIVCQEGAVVRDGIDIDRHDSVGSLEMGEVVEAYDRCINSSGVLRYRTRRGWVSELTRGNGRENITEVLDVRVRDGGDVDTAGTVDDGSRRVECGVPDLRSAAAAVLARLQGSQSDLFSSLMKVVVSDIRSPQRSLSFQSNASAVGPHVIAAAGLLASNLRANFDYVDDEMTRKSPTLLTDKDETKVDRKKETKDDMTVEMKDEIAVETKDDEDAKEKEEEESPEKKEASFAKAAAACMYLGNQLDLLHSSLCEEKREVHRCVFNVPLLMNLLPGDGIRDGLRAPEAEETQSAGPEGGGVVLNAIRFVLMHSLRDMARFVKEGRKNVAEQVGAEGTDETKKSSQRMSRAVASSLPPTLSLLRRLVSRPLLVDSQISTSLARMAGKDLAKLTSAGREGNADAADDEELRFDAPQFARALHLKISALTISAWTDPRLACAPGHVVHPLVQLLGDVVRSLEEASLPTVAPSRGTSRTAMGPPGGRRMAAVGEALRAAMPNAPRMPDALAQHAALLRRHNAIMDEADGEEGPAPGPDAFEPSEDSISRLAEMGFARDHALEALETVGSNRVEVAMEYALTHPPSSPTTLERRRAARERRRQEQRRRRETAAALRQAVAAPADDADTVAPPDPDPPANDAAGDGAAEGGASQPETKLPTEEEKRAERERKFEERSAAEAKEYLQKVKASLCGICLDTIEGSIKEAAGGSNAKAEGQEGEEEEGDSRSVVVVMSNFILDICRAYPALESDFATELLRRLKAKLDVRSPSHCRVRDGCERVFAALAHASVIVFRALPKLRPFLLRQGLVGMITHAITSAIRSGKDATSSQSPAPSPWPRWLPPVLLILEVMAQPTSVTLDDEGGEEVGTSKPANKKSEYGKVLAEHKKQIKKQTATATSIFSALTNKDTGRATPKKKKDAPESSKRSEGKSGDAPAGEDGDSKKKDPPSGEEGEPKKKARPAAPTPPPPIPSFLPLLHTETQEACMILCLRLLGLRSKRGRSIDRTRLEDACPPPAVVNAVLILLVRVLRSRRLSSLCLQMGGADLILALPGRAWFAGNRDLVSLVLRRMLEEEVTLHAMMEGEIRSVVGRIFRKQHPSYSAQATPKVNLKSFMQACAPLMSRDPLVFLKAIASTVKIGQAGSESSSLSSSRGSQVTLLNAEERARNAKILSSHFARNSTDAFSSEKPTIQEEQPTRRSSRGRSKSPHRSSLAKSPSKSALPIKNNYKSLNIDGTPANHVTSLLLKEIMRDPNPDEPLLDDGRPFLSTISIIDTLSDLVLAVPACGAAVHRFKLPKDVVIRNAIFGRPDPPQTAVSYILHRLLPQPRVAPKQELDGGVVSDAETKIRLQAENKSKTAQAGARLIVCLVARSGEGRRRALTDLVFALSCGQRPIDKMPSNPGSRKNPQRGESSDENAEMWALSAWADLCMGLSAPRSGAGGLSDSNSSLSFGVVKTMLEAGIAHALMAAIERIRLHHPMASAVASSIIRPLEIFTRGSVYNTVVDMVEKEKAKMEDAKSGKESRRVTFGPSLRKENSLYGDAALEDEFVNNSSRRLGLNQGDSLEDASMEHSSQEEDDEIMEEDSDDSSEIEVRLGNVDVDYSDASNDSGNPSDEEVSSGSSSDGEGASDDESDEENMDDEDPDDEGESLFSSDDEDEGEVGDWNDDDFFDGNAEDEVNNGGTAGGADADDGNMEGWTRVGGRGGLGNMLLDMQPQQVQGRAAHQHGFLMDAAETMLGNILRGDIGIEGLSEIEDTLGIRVVRGDGRGGGIGLPLTAGLTNPGPHGPAGTNSIGSGRPSVHQNTAVFGNRIVEFSPMEFVFGAPATGAGGQGNDVTTSSANEDDHGRQSDSLFPGGLAASTHPRTRPSIHPLLQNVRLPPINSLVSTPLSNGEGSGSAQERITRTISSSGSYISGTNGNIIRVNDRLQSHEGGARRTTVYGWLDDGLPPDRSTEDFSVSFGQALDTFLQEQADHALSSQHQAAQNDDNPPENDEGSAPPEGSESSPRDENDNAAAADSELPDENIDVADTNNSGRPPAEESQSEAAEVSGAMAAVRVSQPASDTPTPPNPSILNDQTRAESNTGDTSERTDDAVMADEPSVGADVEENVQAQEEVQPNDQPTDAPEALLQAQESNDEEDAPDENATINEEPPTGENGQLTCPPDIDLEVFMSLPVEMQQEIVQQHEVDAQISESGLDPEALAALPEEMRREVMEQEQQQQRQREQQASEPAADPANAEDMDNASFLASLAPDLRQEILLTADDAFVRSLPPTLIAEANILRERVASQHRRRAEETNAPNAPGPVAGARPGPGSGARPTQPSDGPTGSSRGRRQRNGKLRIESDRTEIVYTPSEEYGHLLTAESAKAFLSLFYLLSPIQPRTIHKLMLNMCLCEKSRDFFLKALLDLLNNDKKHVLDLLEKLGLDHKNHEAEPSGSISFPPSALIGTTDLVEEKNPRHSIGMFRRWQGGTSAAATVAASLPASARGSGSSHNGSIPPVVARRIISLFNSLCKSSPRVAFTMLCKPTDEPSCLEKLLDLLEMNQYSQSASNLEQLLSLLEIVVAPMSLLPKDDQAEIDLNPDRSSPGREWVKVPRKTLSKRRLHLLINTLRLESCKDTSFLKVNTLTRRLSRVEANRECILDELVLVAEGLGKSAIQDLKAVGVRLSSAAKHHKEKLQSNGDDPVQTSSAVSLSTSNSELKLLRVLQMLNSLCAQDDETKFEGNPGTEFVSVLQSLKLESLWDQLSLCLKTVGVLEGVANADVDDNNDGEEEDTDNDNNDDTNGKAGKKLQNSVAGLITRFLPAIEAFFMVNASSPSEEKEPAGLTEDITSVVDNSRVVQFAATNKILLNALLRSNPQLLEKGLRAMVKMPKCRIFLDFDVKRQWFRTQVRRLRQQASRRHGSFRLNLRRKHVFEDSFHAFIHRNADELRGRLHITFQNEEGVDAGGLSREFFAILAKEMFNPNYALFMSTEDGCTFQPNPNSSINPDDMRYFRFVGRIVGKAVVDGFLLDAHFTRSLYKHMLGVKPTHHDMQAIDPDYYKNLQMILDHNLEDIGLELTFSTEDHSFGRSRTIDLIPGGRTISVSEETKARYVDLVCQYRMTQSIENQIKAYLEGFHEMVDTDLISIFTPKELELLISGMPDIDIHDLKKNTDYNGYRPADKVMGWFWNIMFALSRSEKAAFLQFVTGSSKVPLAGFSELQGMRGVQKFSINKASGPAGALMSAHTCFNALDLPVYTSEEQMKEKLLYAISEGSGGFGFA